MTHDYDNMRELAQMARADGAAAYRPGRWIKLALLQSMASIVWRQPTTQDERDRYAVYFALGWNDARSVRVEVQR